MPNPEPRVPVALLCQTGELGQHLRQALTELGAPVVYEALTAKVDRDALEESGARVVVVNLDPEVDAHLDDVYALLEDERYNVVFNEAQVSSRLSGWEHARWARHLAAKILGADVDPPRPVGAEPVPVPVRAPESASAPTFVSESVADSPAPALPGAVAAVPAPEPVVPASVPEPAVLLPFDTSAVPAAALVSAPPAAGEDQFEFASLDVFAPSVPAADAQIADANIETLDFAALDAFATPAMPASGKGSGGVPAIAAADFDFSGFGDSAAAGAAAEPALPAPATAASTDDAHTGAAEGLDFADLGDFAGTFDLDSPNTAVPATTDLDIGGLLPLSADTEPETIGLSTDAPWDWAPRDAALDAIPAAAPPVPPVPEVPDFSAWSLEELIENEPATTPAAPAQPKAADFGIEKLTATEFLAPEGPAFAPPMQVPESALSLELIPMEEAVAPRPVEELARESWLDPHQVSVPAKIRRVWVLGASIGGPEAVREFLAAIPGDYPALFLLAQHMGAEFIDLMAKQLAKVTALTVRTPTHGDRVGHGEVLVVPVAQRLRVDAQGVVIAEPIDQPAAYSPSIDQVLSDIADRFGANAGAIVFSGMAEDAAEGARRLVEKGGVVYVQDPATCVVSSMIDGVRETGVVSFVGSPAQLAEKLLAERS